MNEVIFKLVSTATPLSRYTDIVFKADGIYLAIQHSRRSFQGQKKLTESITIAADLELYNHTSTHTSSLSRLSPAFSHTQELSQLWPSCFHIMLYCKVPWNWLLYSVTVLGAEDGVWGIHAELSDGERLLGEEWYLITLLKIYVSACTAKAVWLFWQLICY